MFTGLRNGRGGPSLRVRILAVLLVVGLAVLSAPLIARLVGGLLDAVAPALF